MKPVQAIEENGQWTVQWWLKDDYSGRRMMKTINDSLMTNMKESDTK